MFIKATHAAKLFKLAYKGVGLRVGKDDQGIYLTGRRWYMYIFSENMPKEVLGAIISQTGEIPAVGEQKLYSKGSIQTEMFETRYREDAYKRALEAQAEGEVLRKTQVILLDSDEKPFAVYRSSENLYAVPYDYSIMCSPLNCEEQEDMQGCFAKDRWIYWISDYMAFGLAPYEDEELDETLDQFWKAEIL